MPALGPPHALGGMAADDEGRAQEGHQAAQCPNGTINWRKRFPAGELMMFDVPQPRPAPDYAGIEAQARAFALKREELEAVARGAAGAGAAGAAGAAGGQGDTAMEPQPS